MKAQNVRRDSRRERMLRGIIAIVYIVAGIAVANSHHYFTHVNGLMDVLSAVLAVLLWPLVLLGVDLHLGATVLGAFRH